MPTLSGHPHLTRTEHAAQACAVAVVLALFGLLSMSLGQDANWDLLNYHRYNPWAWLDHRLDLDLAPGGSPTYLNPLLDLPHAWLTDHLPPRAVAFTMGAWHGVGIVLLYVIGRGLLAGEPRPRAVAALLALVAAADSTFLAELGNTMGDDTTAVPMLAAFALVIHARRDTDDPTRRTACLAACLAAGCLAGVATGLKLTNAPCALGLLAAVVVGRRERPTGAWQASAVGLAIGFIVSYGLWGFTLWRHFGNPFFPQFNALFEAPLAISGHLIETRWQPRDALEAACFPLLFSIFPMRINEMPLVDPLWPIAYVGLLASGVVAVLRRWRTAGSGPRRSHAIMAIAFDGGSYRCLVAFVAVGYLLWMTVFSVGRYAVVIELLLPLLVTTTLSRLLGRAIARPVLIVALASALIFPALRFDPLGRAAFADLPYRVEVPTIADPARTTVLVPGAPMSWMLPAFPDAVAFIGFATRFPESDAYRSRVRSIIAARGGPVFALLPAEANEEGSGRWRLNRWLEALGSTTGDPICRYASAIVANAPASDLVFAKPMDAGDRRCRFDRDPARHGALMHDTTASSRALAERGYAIDVDACSAHHAWIGAEPFDYRFCPVHVR